MTNDNYIQMVVPRDQYVSSNVGKRFTLRQLKDAVRNYGNMSAVCTQLGLRTSGPANDFLRHKMVQYNVPYHGKFASANDYDPKRFFRQDERVIPGLKTMPLPAVKSPPSGPQLSVDKLKLEVAATLMLEAMGEDPRRDGLKDTPKRFAKYIADIMNGNFLNPEDYITEFENDGKYTGPVVVTNMPFYTFCEHHLAPFIGTWDFAYKPKDRVLGLSKVVRIARVSMKRPQVQERLTQQIADDMMKYLEPEWVVVRMGAEHFCMSTRGVRTPGSKTYTRSVLGQGAYNTKDILPIPEGA